MKNRTGIPVRGADYFQRETLMSKARDLIERGSNILIAAPRRVGKTSLMFFLMDHPNEPFYYQYLITESVNNENEFYRRLLNKLIKNDHLKKSEKILTILKTHLPKITKIGPEGIEFGIKDTQNYFELVSNILKAIDAHEILNCAIKYNLRDSYKDLVNSLVYDGYINNQEQVEIYTYNSPLLQMWWRQNVAH